MIVLEEKLYTSEETASILGINTRTLYRYLKKGDIEAETKTKSGTFRFTRNQIYRYLYPEKYEKIISLLKKKEHSKYAYLDNSVLTKPIQNTSDSFSDSSKDVPNLSNQGNNKNANPSADPVLKDTSPSSSISSSIGNSNQLKDNPPPVSTGGGVDNKPQPNSLHDASGSYSKDINDIVGSNSNKDSANQNTSGSYDKTQQGSTTTNVVASSSLPNQPQFTNTSPNPAPASVSDAEVEKIKRERESRNLNDELKSLESSIQGGAGKQGSNNDGANSEEGWKYYLNESKDILQLAREVNSLSSETGRKYAATMKGGLSLHHDIDEFKQVHFYVDSEDLNWWVNHLELSYATKADANICLIPTRNNKVFENSYKLRGLQVVADEVLIQDLMKHGEKDLAKTLL